MVQQEPHSLQIFMMEGYHYEQVIKVINWQCWSMQSNPGVSLFVSLSALKCVQIKY